MCVRRSRKIKYASTHRLALDEYGIFFVFPIPMPSFKLLFVYLMSENADWIHKNLHEEVPPHPLEYRFFV
jgi:hypothetical protein